MRTQGPFQGGVNLGEQPADPVRCGGDLRGEVVIESAEDPEFGQYLIVQSDGPQCVRHGPCRFGNDHSILGVGLGLPRMQVCDTPHRQAWQVTHGRTRGLGDRHRKGADAG